MVAGWSCAPATAETLDRAERGHRGSYYRQTRERR